MPQKSKHTDEPSGQTNSDRESFLLLPDMSPREIVLTIVLSVGVVTLAVLVVFFWAGFVDWCSAALFSWLPEWLLGFGRRITAALGGATFQFPGSILVSVLYRFWSLREHAKREGDHANVTYSAIFERCRVHMFSWLFASGETASFPILGCFPALLLTFAGASAAWFLSLSSPNDTQFWVLGGVLLGGLVSFGLCQIRFSADDRA